MWIRDVLCWPINNCSCYYFCLCVVSFFYSCRLPACFFSCLFSLYPLKQFSFPVFISISDFISEAKMCRWKWVRGFLDCFYYYPVSYYWRHRQSPSTATNDAPRCPHHNSNTVLKELTMTIVQSWNRRFKNKMCYFFLFPLLVEAFLTFYFGCLLRPFCHVSMTSDD